MDYYLFLDESGDHGLTKVDPSFPIFILCGVLMYSEDYKALEVRVKEFKRKFWGDKKVILHSRDIRKADKEFQILLDQDIKASFYLELNKIMSEMPYTIITSAVDKERYIQKYGRVGGDIYATSLSNIFERTVFYMNDVPGGRNRVFVFIENRGSKEDKLLDEYIQKIMSRGTWYVKEERIKSLIKGHKFFCKEDDITGIQIADLMAYPIARHIIDKDRANLSFDIVKQKFYQKNGKIFGLKVLP